MSRLDELSKIAPTSEKLPMPPTAWRPDAPNVFSEVSIVQLYLFLWKIFFASLLFAAPYLLYLLFKR